MASGKLRIGVDVDDVVADLLTAWLNRYNKENGTEWTPNDLIQWEIWEDLDCSKDDIFKHLDPSIYNEVVPFDGVADAINAIEKLGHTITFITSCASNSSAKNAAMFHAKVDWLNRTGIGGIGRPVIGCGNGLPHQSKNDVDVDWLIDDHIGNLEKFTRGYPILVTRPHNRNLIWQGKRIRHLRDIVPLLKYATPTGPQDEVNYIPETTEADLCYMFGHPGSNERTRYEMNKAEALVMEPGIVDGIPAMVRQFETGATRDTETGKLDYEAFFSPAVLKRRAEFMHKNRFQRDGSMRAGDNWQKGIPTEAYMKSLARHFMTVWGDYRAGKPLPQEEVCALMFNAEGLLHEDLKKQGA